MEILTLRSELSSINESLVRFAYRNLSHASEALEIISLKAFNRFSYSLSVNGSVALDPFFN